MVILTNPELMSAIQNSYSLQQFLTKEQINTFVEKSLELGQDAQDKLLQKFQQEQTEVNKNKTKNIENIEKYESDIKKLIKQFKQQAKTDENNNNNKYTENILENL